MKNAINWFEIPTRNLDGAVRFYEQALGITLKRETFGGTPHGVFPFDPEGKSVSGAIVASPELQPGASGPLIYLDAPDGVKACLARVERAGGTVVMPAKAIPPHGFIGMFKDPEGNLVGLHAMTETGTP